MMTPVDGAAFRAAMRHPANAVAIVATGMPGARSGLTATAVCSLSDDPPSVLACLNQRSGTCRAVLENRVFSVNFLNAGQISLARLFSGEGALHGEARFTDPLWARGASGAPVLRDCLATFDCVLVADHDHGSHRIVIGTVIDVSANHVEPGLVYGRRAFTPIVAQPS